MELELNDYDGASAAYDALGHDYEATKALADLIWRSVRAHPLGASCECPAMEAVNGLLQLGFRFERAASPCEAPDEKEDVASERPPTR